MNSLHPFVKEAFEEIDSAVFSGDSFYEEENLNVLKYYIERWKKTIPFSEELIALDKKEKEE